MITTDQAPSTQGGGSLLGRAARRLKRLGASMRPDAPDHDQQYDSQKDEPFWTDEEQLPLIARNVLSQYVVLGVNMLLGLVMLPFNVAHLGQSAYGLWVLVTSVTTYFDVLEMGYGSSQVKFTAQYRARRDAQALNDTTRRFSERYADSSWAKKASVWGK